MNANPKRPLEEHGNDGKPEIYEASVAWGDERPYKFPRKDPREVERKIPATSAQPQQQQQQQPQLQHWGYVPGYPPLVISEGYENKEKERERESSKDAAKMGEAKDEEVKIEVKAQVEENMELKPEKDTDLNKLEKNQNVDGKDPKGDSNYRHHHIRSENEGCESVPPEGGEFSEAKETVGENRVGDWRKEKEERKRKEENLNAGGERKEKEKVKDKEISLPVKEVEVKEENMEIDGRITGKEVDDKDRKKEREKQGDVERERHERRTRHHNHDKEVTDDGLGDGEGNLEKDKGDSFYGGIHQRRRMLRPRGHSQAGSREARSRFRPRDSDGFQGRSESSAVTYKVGECMQEIIKLWKEFEASNDLRNMENPAIEHPTLEIRIPAEHVTTANHQVRGSQLWGTDIYTDDSDLVAVLMHTGYYRPTAALPPPSIQELRATIRVLAPSDSYRSTLRNSVRSRAWGAASGCSYKVEKCRIMKKGGGSIELEPCLMRISAVAPTLAPAAMERTMTTRAAASSAYRQQRYMREVTIQYNLCNEPWMKYSISIVADRGLKRSQFTSARLKKGEVLFVETHWARYELSYDGEKATSNGPFGATTATSAPSQVGNLCERMDKTPVNEMEKHLPVNSQNGDKVHSVGENADRFKWARCKQALPQKVMQSIGIPLPHDHVKVLEENLDWEELQWSQTGVWVRGKEYCLTRAHFLSSN